MVAAVGVAVAVAVVAGEEAAGGDGVLLLLAAAATLLSKEEVLAVLTSLCTTPILILGAKDLLVVCGRCSPSLPLLFSSSRSLGISRVCDRLSGRCSAR